jgi:hypothetical protein
MKSGVRVLTPEGVARIVRVWPDAFGSPGWIVEFPGGRRRVFPSIALTAAPRQEESNVA